MLSAKIAERLIETRDLQKKDKIIILRAVKGNVLTSDANEICLAEYFNNFL